MTDNGKRYCIGKATRYQDGDVVRSVPFAGTDNDVCAELRSKSYRSREAAELAAKIAKACNPVGFVVLELDERMLDDDA